MKFYNMNILLLFTIILSTFEETIGEYTLKKVADDLEMKARETRKQDFKNAKLLQIRIAKKILDKFVLNSRSIGLCTNPETVNLVKTYCNDEDISQYVKKNLTKEDSGVLEDIKLYIIGKNDYTLTSCMIYDIMYPDYFSNMDNLQYDEYIANPNNKFTDKCVKAFNSSFQTVQTLLSLKDTMYAKKDLYLPKANKLYEKIIKLTSVFTLNELNKAYSIYFKIKNDYDKNPADLTLILEKNEQALVILPLYRFVYKHGVSHFLKDGILQRLRNLFLYNTITDSGSGEKISFVDFVLELLNICPEGDKLAYAKTLLPYLCKEDQIYDFEVSMRIINFFSIPDSREDSSCTKYFDPFIFTFLNSMDFSQFSQEELKKLLKNVLSRKYDQSIEKSWKPLFLKFQDYCSGIEGDKYIDLLYTATFGSGNIYFCWACLNVPTANKLREGLRQAYELKLQKDRKLEELNLAYLRISTEV